MKRVMFALLLAMAIAPSAWGQSWPNEPSGSTVINDWNWNSCPGGGWQPAYGCGAIRSDSTAPRSPNSVLAMEFNPASGAGGGDPFIAINATEVYIGYWVKLSNPFQGETNLSNKLTYGFDGSFGHGYWTKFYGQQNGPFTLQFHLQGFDPSIDNCHISSGFGECFNRAWNMSTTVTKGVWHRVELYYKHSTSRTSRDGIARLWLDGVQQLNLTNLNTPDGVINDLYFSPTWAGPADPNRTNPDVISFDHVHVSSGGTGGGGTPKGDTTPPAAPVNLRAQ